MSTTATPTEATPSAQYAADTAESPDSTAVGSATSAEWQCTASAPVKKLGQYYEQSYRLCLPVSGDNGKPVLNTTDYVHLSWQPETRGEANGTLIRIQTSIRGHFYEMCTELTNPEAVRIASRDVLDQFIQTFAAEARDRGSVER